MKKETKYGLTFLGILLLATIVSATNLHTKTNWWIALNQLIEGFIFGLGAMLAVIFFIRITDTKKA